MAFFRQLSQNKWPHFVATRQEPAIVKFFCVSMQMGHVTILLMCGDNEAMLGLVFKIGGAAWACLDTGLYEDTMITSSSSALVGVGGATLLVL